MPVQPHGAAEPTGGVVAGIHPERVTRGAHPDRGIVLTGTVTGGRPSGPAGRPTCIVSAAEVTCRLAERPARTAAQLVVTALDPPCFGPDGRAVRLPEAGPGAAWPVQVSA